MTPAVAARFKHPAPASPTTPLRWTLGRARVARSTGVRSWSERSLRPRGPRKLGPMSDDALTGRKEAALREPDALSARIEGLVREWSEVIRTAGRRYGLSPADLDEVRQDVRLRLWHAIERAGEREITTSYGYRAAASAAVDLLRRHRVSRGRLPLAESESIAGSALDEGVLERRLGDALAVVPESRRVAVRLHLNGHSLADVARVLHWTPAQARNQVYRGLADLKRVLQGAEGTRR